MSHRTLPAVALVLVTGCATASAGTASSSHVAPASSATATVGRASAPVFGPPGPDAACAAALKAEQILTARQAKDQGNESALDQDFTNFANALSAAAQQETHPAAARAMTALAADYNDLVESQTKPALSRFSGQVQVVPLTENDAGEVSLLVQVPWKPSVVLAPGAMVAL